MAARQPARRPGAASVQSHPGRGGRQRPAHRVRRGPLPEHSRLLVAGHGDVYGGRAKLHPRLPVLLGRDPEGPSSAGREPNIGKASSVRVDPRSLLAGSWRAVLLRPRMPGRGQHGQSTAPAPFWRRDWSTRTSTCASRGRRTRRRSPPAPPRPRPAATPPSARWPTRSRSSTFKRAGCSGVLTYHAAHAARLLND